MTPTPTPTPLSPAGQAVLTAWLSSERGQRMLGDPACLAAAFRAAASQMEFVQDVQRLLAIAAELEGPANG